MLNLLRSILGVNVHQFGNVYIINEDELKEVHNRLLLLTNITGNCDIQIEKYLERKYNELDRKIKGN